MSAVSKTLMPASTAASSVALISRIGTELLIDPTRPQPTPSTETRTPPSKDRRSIISRLLNRNSPGLRGGMKIIHPILGSPHACNHPHPAANVPPAVLPE